MKELQMYELLHLTFVEVSSVYWGWNLTQICKQIGGTSRNVSVNTFICENKMYFNRFCYGYLLWISLCFSEYDFT